MFLKPKYLILGVNAYTYVREDDFCCRCEHWYNSDCTSSSTVALSIGPYTLNILMLLKTKYLIHSVNT